MANILIKQGLEIAVPDFVITTDEARKVDLTSIIQTGTTSTQAISAGTYFYLNSTLVRAKVDIANGATFTLNTNYEVVTAGALNELNDSAVKSETFTGTTNANGNILTTYDGTKAILGIKINTPSDYYGIPYYSNSSSLWAIRVKKWDDTTLLNTQVTGTIYIRNV